MNSSLIIISIIINSFFLIFFKKISSIYNVYDSADGLRKFQKSPVSLIGGGLIFFNFLFFIFFNYFFEINLFENSFFTNNREFFSFIMGSSIFFIFGILDDKYKLKPNTKLFTLFILTLFFVMLDENLLVTNLKFYSFDHVVQLNIFSYFFTILCFLLFINALNMFDGINLQVGFYCILIFSVFVFKGVFFNLSIIIIISLIFFLYLNYNNKTYLGESGIQFLAFTISYIIIKTYNLNQELFFVDEIFILMALPGLELFRLFLLRVAKGKHPFKADTDHLHHLLLRSFSSKKTFLIIFLFIVSTIILYNFTQYKVLFITLYCILYVFVIFYLKKRK